MSTIANSAITVPEHYRDQEDAFAHLSFLGNKMTTRQYKENPAPLFRALHLLSVPIFSRPQRDPSGDNIFFIRPSAYHLFIPPSPCDTNPPFDVSNKFCK